MDNEEIFQEDFYAVEVSDEIEGIVDVDTLNVREFPNVDSKSIKILRKGEVVTIVDTVDDWCHISLPINGYCKAEFISI